MLVHEEILEVSHALDEALMRIAVPHYETSATAHEVNCAQQFSVSVVMAAFDGNIPHDYSAGKFNDEQLAALLPQFEGALKLAKALNAKGVTLPVRGKLLERTETVVRAWLRDRRHEKALKVAKLENDRPNIAGPPLADQGD